MGTFCFLEKGNGGILLFEISSFLQVSQLLNQNVPLFLISLISSVKAAEFCCMGHTIKMNNDDLRYAREAWRFRGQARPPGAEEPGPGQESVWDYPRPPVIVDDMRPVEVRLDDVLIAKTRAARRVLETASPPSFYLPPESVHFDCLRPETGSSNCEWKGQASYFSVCAGTHCVKRAAWTYPEPLPGFATIGKYLAFYPDRLECYVDGERVRAQTGGYYGGWITGEIVGPFKGGPGTSGW
jgi:uncharacterized protein (DUF427 family)